MSKFLNVLAVVALALSCFGIGYLISTPNDTKVVLPSAIQMPQMEAPGAVRVYSNIQYGADKRQSLDIYLPSGSGNFPVLFFVHGGAWSSGEKETYGSVGYFYAKKGYVTLVVDHRLSPQVIHPAHIEDVAKAFAWTKHTIANYGGDPNKVYLCGHSSGAHLVSLLVTNQKYLTKEGIDRSGIRGVVAISGIYSLGRNINFAGYGYIFPTNEAKKDASPINFIDRGTPPFLLLYADSDITTLGSQATNFNKALQGHGVHSILHCVKGCDHVTVLLDCVTPDHSSKSVLDFMK